ncbi:MAG: DUF1015 family protein, partial [Lentisphaerae bacterium]|nr:DUF1015 family protein [Lentisphaerota bacterium]
AQSGIVACCHVDDYRADVIKKHERTRREKEADRTRHIDLVNAHTGPVLLTYRDHPEIDRLVAQTEESVPLYDFTASDGVQHTVWAMPAIKELQRCFQDIPVAYIADGHHRAASSVRVAECRRAAGATDAAECNWFMTMLFPAGQMNILPYNRLVIDLNGLTPAQLLQAAGRAFEISDNAVPPPGETGVICMYLENCWYQLCRRDRDRGDPIAALDVSALQNELLSPVLGIADPRSDPRIDFIGGSRGTEELERRVRQLGTGVAFAMYPVTVAQLMAIADRGLIMPPKSTWFDPKPCSGLLVHELADQ